MQKKFNSNNPVHAVCLLTMTLALGLAGCASQKSKPADAGFLTDYSRLVKQDAKRGDAHLDYVEPNAARRVARIVYLLPLAPFPVTTKMDALDPATLKQCAEYLDQRLRADLGKRVTLATGPTGADTTVDLALTAVGAVEEGRTMLDLVPLRLITKPLKDAAMGKPMHAAATLEVRVTDTGSRKVVREAQYRSVGEGIGREGDPKTIITFLSLKPVLDSWADSLANDIAPVKP